MHPNEDPRFAEYLKSPHALEILLRGHLWVEAELIGVLEDVLPFPDQIDLNRASFQLKVSMAAAHGFIRPDDVAAYLTLNSLRNRVAHDLNGEPNEEFVEELLRSFGPHLKHIYPRKQEIDETEGPKWLWKLRFAIACMCISLSGERKKLAEHRRQQQEVHNRYLSLVQRVKEMSPQHSQEQE
jgi:hypothetical protein